MARYIDADKLWNDRPQIPEGKSQDYGAGFSECMWGFSRNIRKQIDTESADVVPKSEVQRLVGEYYDKCDECRSNCAKAVAQEIFEEIEREIKNHGITYARRKIAELKKKRTEEKK